MTDLDTALVVLGKVALSLWFAATANVRRQISVSVCCESADLQRFVLAAAYRWVVRDFRDAGAL
ncbi:hypothetical protein [Actinomadura fibrosa]|uniref:Transposase n=1 Tax=Actinomadura fibrosa TaxID=111802 RepID=A0ABW2XRY7_9ACTN|nr:hypothetical protein [Actinomadura fibrosa]